MWCNYCRQEKDEAHTRFKCEDCFKLQLKNCVTRYKIKYAEPIKKNDGICKYCGQAKAPEKMRTKYQCLQCRKEKETAKRKLWREKNSGLELAQARLRHDTAKSKERYKQWINQGDNKRKKYDKSNAWAKKAAKSIPYRYKSLLDSAVQRGRLVEISIEEYEKLVSVPCYYCSGELDTDKGYGFKLDRLDNSIGYAIVNLVCCCNFCNKIKQDLLTPEENKAAIQAIIAVKKRKIFL